jgi:hypothetical protein
LLSTLRQLICPNCKAPVKEYQLFAHSCAYCDNALQRGLAGVRSSTVTHQGSKKKEDASGEFTDTFILKLTEPVFENEVPFSSFYVKRILTRFHEKHPGFSWAFSKDAKDAITAITFTGLPSEDSKKELEAALQWSVKKVLQNRSMNH